MGGKSDGYHSAAQHQEPEDYREYPEHSTLDPVTVHRALECNKCHQNPGRYKFHKSKGYSSSRLSSRQLSLEQPNDDEDEMLLCLGCIHELNTEVVSPLRRQRTCPV